MIKKILLSLGLIGFGLISFANGQFIEKGETIYITGDSENTYVPILNGLTNNGNFYNKAIVVLWHNNFGNYAYEIFYHNNKIYFNHSLGNNSLNNQGYITNWKICDLNENNYNDSSAVNCQGNYDTPINLDDINQVDSIYVDYLVVGSYDKPSILCLIDKSQNKSFCVGCNRRSCPSGYTPGSLINSNNYYDEEAIYELGEDIFYGGGGGDSDNSFSGEIELSNNDIVSYYEDTRGFNYNMCFVGTWDFTQNEGTFKQGNGDNIFSYFNWFYNLGTGINATGYKLSDVGKFIDEMYGNYDIYFNYGNRYSNGDIAYIYKFDINTHILDWIDTGFNNPFDYNTYVYTFYPKTLHYYTDYWRLYYYGGDLANYCYYKLNFNNSPQEEIYGNLENDISQETLNNVGDWKIISTNIKPTQSGNVLSVSEDWNGSPIDYFVQENSSGNYENFDAGTFFTDSFNRFKGVFGELNPGDFGFGYLPGYIITFMLAFILFRFLSH